MEGLNNIDQGSIITFEDFKNTNGLTYWWATDVMSMFGYTNLKSFQKVLDRATKAMVSLNIPHYENIIAIQREFNGEITQDFKMTRFACYLAAMNGDPKKPEVAYAQAYFAEQTRKFELYIENAQEIERVSIRDELSDGNKSLASAAKHAGVTDYARFQNAGYLGMYNMEVWKLERKRGIPKGKIMDTMGRTELAANLFRVTQTEERIRNYGITGQSNLEQTHYEVGKEVREITIRNVGDSPENLPQGKQLPEVKRELKKGYNNMKKIDKNK